MKVTAQNADGFVQLDGRLGYATKTVSNTPYCHFCRKRHDVVAILVPGNPGNPRHACADCLREFLNGFETLENEKD